MTILDINAFHGDSSTCLLRDEAPSFEFEIESLVATNLVKL